jgi:RNA exonuclease 4
MNINNKDLKYDRGGNTSPSHTIRKSYSPFDESATLATVSTLSMSSSDEYEKILEDTPKYENRTISTHRSKNTKQSNGVYNKYNNKNNKSSNNSSINNSNGKGKGKGKGRGKRSPRRSKATSTKTHDKPMKRRDIYFALDCEMVGVGPEGIESALARVSIVNWDNEIVLDTYVKVDAPVTDYRTFVSGIEPEQIESASALPIMEVRSIVKTILQGKILIGHGLVNDLKVMGINHPWCDIRDTATYAPFMVSRESRSAEEKSTLCPRRLRDLCWEKLGKQIQVMGKAHSPVEDAVAAMDLYKEARNDWEMAMVHEVNKANRANDEHNRRMPAQVQMPHSQHTPKPSPVDVVNMPLFPTHQHQFSPMNSPMNSPMSSPMRFAVPSLQQMSHMTHVNQRLAPERNAQSRAAFHHNMMYQQLHC